MAATAHPRSGATGRATATSAQGVRPRRPRPARTAEGVSRLTHRGPIRLLGPGRIGNATAARSGPTTFNGD
jgi:hypothetical protein